MNEIHENNDAVFKQVYKLWFGRIFQEVHLVNVYAPEYKSPAIPVDSFKMHKIFFI
jgi:hypothetical protein